MTHFRCAVFSYDPGRFAELLAPYGEDNDQVFEFIPATRTVAQLEEDFKANAEKGYVSDDTSFEDWVQAIGYKFVDGVLGYYANPNAKWDWYTLNGGDWMFDLKRGEKYDENGNAKKNQYSYKDKEFDKEYWTSVYEEMKQTADNRDHPEYEYANAVLTAYPTLNKYLHDKRLLYPYAYITPDGAWHAPGNMGWFAMSDETPESTAEYLKGWEDYIKSDENPYVNFVDCHI